MKLLAVLPLLWAMCSAHPFMWINSSINTKKSCLVPLDFKIPPDSLMSAQSVTNAKNGPDCKIVFKGNTITVSSDISDFRNGYIVLVTEGTVKAPRDAVPSGNKGDTCAWGEGKPSGITFEYTPPAKPSGKPILAGASCGNYMANAVHTTYKVARTA